MDKKIYHFHRSQHVQITAESEEDARTLLEYHVPAADIPDFELTDVQDVPCEPRA